MEVPYNTTIFKEMKIHGQTVRRWPIGRPSATGSITRSPNWRRPATPRQRLHGGEGSAKTKFLYRDLLWTGADMIGLGVASFSHVGGTHFQNRHDFEPYIARFSEGKLPIYRALTPPRKSA